MIDTGFREDDVREEEGGPFISSSCSLFGIFLFHLRTLQNILPTLFQFHSERRGVLWECKNIIMEMHGEGG